MTYFLAGELAAEERDADCALFQVIPVPLERTVSYGSGTAQGPKAIIEASTQLERLFRGAEPCARGIATQEAVDCSGPLPDVMEAIAARAEAAVRVGTIPVVLGGEHALSYGVIRGISRATTRRIGILQVDAHADLRRAYQGERHSHASVMQLLVEEEGVALAQFGVRALCQEEMDRRKTGGVFFKDAEELVVGNVQAVDLPSDFPKDIYITFDVDGLDPSILPDTGTPVPGGLGYYQALNLLRHAMQGRRLLGCDVVELAPGTASTVSSFTTAQITYALMSLAH